MRLVGRAMVWLQVAFVLCRAAHVIREGVCDDPVNAQLPFCDESRDIGTRVDDLVARIPITAVGDLLVDNSSSLAVGSATTLKLHAYEWWNEALHGVGISPGVKFQAPTLHATSFPQVLTVAASFNRTLFHQIGEAISDEARAFYNVGNGGLTYWAPNINIFRDPRWGRGQETPGEDPFLTSEYAATFVRGMQGEAMERDAPTDNNTFLKVSATCKHFSSYSQEVPRHRNDAIVTKQDQADTYLPAFEACVKRGHASGLMCSYNAVNGIPSCADKAMLTDLIRTQWKFDGYIVSDCGAIQDIIYSHHYTQSPTRTCATALNAGVDLNCGQFLKQHVVKALEEGVLDREVVRTALKRLFRVQMRLGMFEKKPQPYSDITPDHIDSTKHRQLVLEAARQSIVLLKNNGNLLPLNASRLNEGKNGSLALVGPHFNASNVLLGNYAGIPSTISTPFSGISSYVANTSIGHAIGCNVSSSPHTLPDFAKAESVARAAEQVVLFVGLDQDHEREGTDRTSLQLPGFQCELIDRMIKAAPTPLIMVVIAGGCVDLSRYVYHPKIGAILYAGYPGQAGGQAIADVLFGQYNPSGRLPQTFYDEGFVETTSLYDMHMRPFEPTGNPGRTYRFYRDPPVFEFGHGLSYTSFRVVMTSVVLCKRFSNKKGVMDWAAHVQVNVTNTGDRAGAHAVLLFSYPPPSQDGPLKQLVEFDRTRELAPHGGSQLLSFQISSTSFALADAQGQWVTQAGQWVLEVDGQRVPLVIERETKKEEDQPWCFGHHGDDDDLQALS